MVFKLKNLWNNSLYTGKSELTLCVFNVVPELRRQVIFFAFQDNQQIIDVVVT